MRFLVSVLAVLSVSLPVHGATIAETLAFCRAKGATLERLACYDELARAVAEGVTLPDMPDAGVGKWIVDQKMDPIDDTMDVGAYLPSEGWVNGLSGAVLQILCFGSGEAFEVQFVLHGVRVANPTDKDEFEVFNMVMWRFDKEKAVSGEWVVHDDREVLYPLSSMVRLQALLDEALLDSTMQSEQVRWARDILGRSQLFVRIRPSGDKRGKGDFVFDLRGAEQAVGPVLDACGW